MNSVFLGPDGHPRCPWSGGAPEFLDYHDREWGFPVDDDRRLFEKICLEGFQSGLSWRTILTKREAFRAAFDQFDFRLIADYTPDDEARLLTNAGIVRHRGKIASVINNARQALDLVESEGSLAAYFWSFEPAADEVEPHSASTSPTSVRLAKDLKKRGWSFVGPTTVFAFMQAMGLINDHARGCVTREAVAQSRAAFDPPRGLTR